MITCECKFIDGTVVEMCDEHILDMDNAMRPKQGVCPHCTEEINIDMPDVTYINDSIAHIDCAVDHARDSQYDACCCAQCMNSLPQEGNWWD